MLKLVLLASDYDELTVYLRTQAHLFRIMHDIGLRAYAQFTCYYCHRREQAVSAKCIEIEISNMYNTLSTRCFGMMTNSNLRKFSSNNNEYICVYTNHIAMYVPGG